MNVLNVSPEMLVHELSAIRTGASMGNRRQSFDVNEAFDFESGVIIV